MNNQSTITVETIIHASIEKTWECWTEPQHIIKWTFASDDWEAPYAENDLTVGGKFKTVMSAKDGSASFDFTGIYTEIKEYEKIKYTLDDGRQVSVEFIEVPQGIKVLETFEPETLNSLELQQSGWQAILDNFKKYVEKSNQQ